MRLGPYLLGPNDTPENGIYTVDCSDGLANLPDKCVDIVLTDPPYFLPAQSYVGARGDKYPRRTLADTSILKTCFRSVFEQVDRVLKSTGAAYVFCDAQSYPVFYEVMFPLFKYVRLLIWDKIASYNGYTWRHQHELIAWGERNDAERIPTGDGDIIRCHGVKQADRRHPAEKPEELMTRLLDKHGGGNIVLDLYAGSGPAGVAAIRTGNQYLLYELDTQHAKMARERVRNTQPPLFVADAQLEQLAMEPL